MLNGELDLDPAMEDILSVWGKDPTAQNVERYFGVPDFLISDPPSSESQWNSQVSPLSAKKVEGIEHLYQTFKDLQQSSKEGGIKPHVSPRNLHQTSKGKSTYIGPVLSGGLEDIVLFGSSSRRRTEGDLGRVEVVTRASIAKGPGSPKRIEGRRDVESEGLPDLCKNPSESAFEAQVCNQSTADLINVFVINLVLAPIEQRPSSLDQGREQQEREETIRDSREEIDGLRKKGEKRKKQRPINSKELEGNLVLGMDVQIEEALEVAECTLVSRERGKNSPQISLKLGGKKIGSLISSKGSRSQP